MDAALRYPAYVLAGIRNRFGRNLAAVFCFALIAANVFSGQYLVAGEVESVDQGISRMGADLVVVPLGYTQLLSDADTDNTVAIVAAMPFPERFDGRLLEDIAGVPGVASLSPQLFVGEAGIPEVSSAPVPVYGVDPATDFTIRPWLRDPADGVPGPGQAVVGHDLRRSVGDVLPLACRTYAVAGVLDPTRSGIDGSVFLSMEDALVIAAPGGALSPGGAAGIAPGAVSAGLVKVASGADPDQVAFALTRQVSPANLTVIARHFSLDPVSQNLQALPGFLNIVSVVVLVAAFPLIALIAAMVANERRREIGLLRAMGARSSVIVLLVMAESLVLAALGAVAGVAASLAALTALEANGVLNSALQVSFRVPAATEIGVYAVVTFLVVIAMGTLSSAYPAYRTGRMNPFDAIRVDGR